MTVPVVHHDFNFPPLRESDLLADPLAQFQRWVDDARAKHVTDWDAMVLSTATPEGRPSARVVFLRGVDQRGFAFYTNSLSRKGRQLAANAQAALVFHWQEIERQVCVEGTVSMLTSVESDEYFAGRPRLSQLGAWASHQSEPLDSAETLQRRVDELQCRFANGPVPRPPHWGGYVLAPDRIEFWQGRPSRLHDRFVYTLDQSHWHRRRLNP